MDFPDIRTSWKAFKICWFRRLMYVKGTWVEILKDAMRPKYIFNNPQSALANIDLIHLSKSVKFIRNDFWCEVFKSLPELMEYYLTKSKNMIPYTNIWGSSVIKSLDGEPLQQTEYSPNVTGIQHIADLMKMNSNGDGEEKTPGGTMPRIHGNEIGG